MCVWNKVSFRIRKTICEIIDQPAPVGLWGESKYFYSVFKERNQKSEEDITAKTEHKLLHLF